MESVSYWLNEITDSQKREKDFRADGKRILEIYGGEKKDEVPFNILYSNTETLLPALYSAVPRPVVQRRFKDDDPMGKAAALAGERALEFLLDTNIDGYETFDEGMRAATLDALLPGRGVTSIKYDAEIIESQADDKGETAEPDAYKDSELVCADTRSWNRVYFGYAKKWSKMPWICYEEHIDKDEATRLFGIEMAGKLTYTDSDRAEEEEKRDENEEGLKTARIYQIWAKKYRKVLWISPQYKDAFLKTDDDPLQLTGFFNCPRPIQFIEKSNDLLPTAIYLLYENQASELNRITVRIKHIVNAIRARGIYDSELGDDIKRLFDAADNELIPADKSSSLAAEKGLQNAIWFAPVEQLVNVLRELLGAREACKQVIFEITGIADIMRGQSNASETLGAQQIKQTWGTLRLKRLQKEVQRYARDMLRMMLEIASTKFSEETWAKMTGLPYLTEAKFAELTKIRQGLQGQAQMEQANQPPPQPGQPPQAPQPGPVAQQLQQIEQQLQAPQWSQILAMLKDDIQRAYRIDIETNSTVEPEAVEDQKNIAEVMNALGQYLNGIGPLVAKGVMPFQAAQAMMLAIVKRFRFGPEIEEYLKQMQAPKPEDDGKAAAEQAKMQAEAQQKQAEMQQQGQMEQARLQQQAQSEQQRMQFDTQKQQADMAMEQARMQAEAQREAARILAEKEANLAQLQAERATERMKAEMQQQTELQKASIAAAAQIQIAQINANCKAESDKQSAEGEAEKNEAAKESSDIMMSSMQETMEGISKALLAMTAPRKIVRDKAGRAELLVVGSQ